jgi:molecular chaperone GrpE
MKKKKKVEEEEELAPEAAAPEEVLEGVLEELPSPAEELERLKAALEAERRLSVENQNRFLKALADLDNYKKRAEKERALILEFANEDLLLEMLPVIDNLERALEHTGGAKDNLESLARGVKLTIDTALAVLKKFGLKEIRAVGEKFDPALHHAISHEDADGVEADMVVKEFQKGYMLKNRLIRPSTVMVSKEPGEDPDEEEGG